MVSVNNAQTLKYSKKIFMLIHEKRLGKDEQGFEVCNKKNCSFTFSYKALLHL